MCLETRGKCELLGPRKACLKDRVKRQECAKTFLPQVIASLCRKEKPVSEGLPQALIEMP